MLRGSVTTVTAQTAFAELLESRTLLSAPVGFTPAQIRHAYGFDIASFTDSLNRTIKGDGTGQTIAIVNAFDQPNLASDLNAFDNKFSTNGGSQTIYQQYGAASSFLTRKTTSASTPSDPGWLWALESSMDIEWAHAIAPKARILLVEAKSDSLGDLLTAVDIARKTPGVSVVSMSWGTPEFASQAAYESYFATPAGHTPVTFIASAGDGGAGALWPSVAPNVISIGGSSLTLNADNSYKSESAWSGSGGSVSLYESKPSYQSSLTLSLTNRSAPDVAYVADPYTGLAVYDTYKNGGWIEVGGTSAGAPQWAGLIAIANQARVATGRPTLDGRAQALPALYNIASSNYHDIAAGSNGYPATPGYDLVTGLGTPVANRLILALQTASSTGTVSVAFAKPATTLLKNAARAQLAMTSSNPTPPTQSVTSHDTSPIFSNGQNSSLAAMLTANANTTATQLASLLGLRSLNLFSNTSLIAIA